MPISLNGAKVPAEGEAALLTEARSLVERCERFDGASPRVQFDHSIAFDPKLTDWYFLREGEDLAGLLSIFAPEREEVEFSVCVAPERRRRGVFGKLVAEAGLELAKAGDPRVLYVVDRDSVSGQALAARKDWRIEHSEYTMNLPPGIPVEADGRVELRRARETDIDVILAAAVDDFGDDRASAESKVRSRILGLDSAQYYALDGGTIVGICSVLHEGGGVSINGVSIRSDLRGRGLGRSMMKALLAGIDRARFSVSLEVDSVNAPAKNLYESLGFQAISAADYFSAG